MRQFAPLILLIAAIFGGIFYVKPLYLDIQKLSSDKAQYDVAIKKAQELNTVITQLNTVKNSFSGDDLDRLQKMIPENIDNIRLIIEMNEIAKKYTAAGMTGVHVTNTANVQASAGQISSQQDADNAVGLGFSISLPYSTFLKFLADLESTLRLADVTSISFTPDAKGPTYTFTVNLKTYWLK